MNIEVQFVGMKGINAVETLVQQKIEKLTNKYSWITNASVFFKHEPNSTDKNRVCEIRLSVPGPQLFAAEKEDSFEKAVHSVIKQLEVQLEKHKSKMQHH